MAAHIRNKLADWLLYSNLLIGLCAVAFYETGALMQSGAFSYDPYGRLFVFASTFSLYLLLRVYSVYQLQERVMSYRLRWVRKRLKLCVALCIIGLLVAAYSFFQLEREVQLGTLPAAVFAIGYGLPFLPFSRKLRLRQIRYIKVFLIAGVWAWVGSVIPGLMMEAYPQSLAIVFVSRFCFILAITIPFDIRDMNTDRSYGLDTLATWLGPTKSARLALGLMVANLLILLVWFMIAELPILPVLVGLAFMGFAVGYLILASKRIRSEYLYLGLLDSTMILEMLVVWGIMWLSFHSALF